MATVWTTALAKLPSEPPTATLAVQQQETEMTEETNPQTAPETQPEDQPVQSGLIAFDDPAGPDALTAQVEEALAATTGDADQPTVEPEVSKEPIQSPALNAMAAAEVRHAANTQAEKDEFARRVLAARTQPPAGPVTQPVAPRIMSQTLAEQAAGRKMNEHHDALKSRGPIQPRSDAEIKATGTTQHVFRPGNVDEYRGTFRSPAQTVSKDNIRQPPR